MISIKKLATVGVAAGLLAASALPVLASHSDDLDIDQENKNTKVKNDIVAWSDTGSNKIKTSGSGSDIEKSDITTGDAETKVRVKNYVNKNTVDLADCDCFDDVDIDQENKNTKVKNLITAWSDTGSNKIKTSGSGSDIEKSDITTGNATTGVSVKNFVNKNKVVIGP